MDELQKNRVEQQKIIIKTDELSVGYNHEVVLQEVEIEIRKGEIIALIGPNGAGKSTLLKTLLRSIEAISGAVFLDQQDMRMLSRQKTAEKMSALMTGSVHAEWMTCEEAVSQGRYPYTGKLGILSAHDKEVVKNAMNMVGVTELRTRYINSLSDGQRQRVMLARAICQEPEVLVLDEPASYLDMKYKLELLKIIKEMTAEKNTAVIMSMHELELVQKIADRVICIKDGRIDKIAAPEKVFTGNYIQELYDIQGDEYLQYIPGYFKMKS